MATGIGKASSFQIFNEEFYSGLVETLQQNSNVFNAASQGAIRFYANSLKGHFQKQAFFDSISSLVSRRDITSTSDVSDLSFTSDVLAWPKVNRKTGPVTHTRDSLLKLYPNEDAQRVFSYNLGQQVAKAKEVDFANTAIKATVAALAGVTSGGSSGSGVVYDGTGDSTTTMTTDKLIRGRARLGDQASRIVAWVMHSKPHADLMVAQAAQVTDMLAGMTVYQGTVGTLGLPVIVVDSSSLINSNGITTGTDSYYTLGLVAGGVEVIDSEQSEMVSDIVTGKENLLIRIQGEHAYNVGVKGFTFNTSYTNPTDAQLATTAYWTNQMADVKSLAGCLIETA